MRKICNFVKLKIAPILFSVILALFLPLHSLTVVAASIAIPSSLGVGYDLYSIYSLFNLLNGVSTPSVSELPNYDELMAAGFTEEQYNSLTSVQFDNLNGFRSGLGDKIRQAIANAVSYGRLALSRDTMDTYKEYLDYVGASSVGDSVPVASSQSDLTVYTTSSSPFIFDLTYYYTSTGNYQHGVYGVNFYNDALFFRVPASSGFYFYLLCLNSNPPDWFTISDYVPTNFTAIHSTITSSSGVSYYCSGWRGLFATSGSSYFTNIVHSGVPIEVSSTQEMYDIFIDYAVNGVSTLDSPVNGTVASEDDVLTSTNSISSDGTIAGDTTVYIPDLSLLEQILADFRNGVADFTTTISALGLSSTASDSTAEEKESALSSVADVVTSVLTIQEAGQTTVDQATNELAESITAVETAEDTFKPYYDPDSEDQNYVPNWFFSLPNLTDPENDTSDIDKLPEIVGAIPIVTTLITELFDSSGPFVLLFYIGITFVLFSVLIGMAHFIGSYGDRASLRASRNLQIRANAERLAYWQSKNK